MKRLLTAALFLMAMVKLFGQSHGISYQAVIIDEKVQEIPGVDVQGNFLPNHPLTVRFTILNSTGTIGYQEQHVTKTDKYGMINLIIGKGVLTTQSPDLFEEIGWDGTPKDLRVEISLDETGSDFRDFGLQELHFVPYAFHRNITATGTLTVDSVTTLNNTLNVNARSFLNEQVVINSTVAGDDDQYGSYPLRVQGSNQGIAISVNASRDNNNNFVSFWDNNGMQGRIEGQTDIDLLNDPGYIFDQSLFAAQTIVQAVNLVTAGVAAVADPGNLIIEGANTAALIAEIAAYNIFAFSSLGVTYESGGGDYAEWLPRLNTDEQLEFGQVVGVYGGKVTKVTDGAEQIMIISKAPIVLGNMAPDGFREEDCEKVCFMGQVPVWVLGKANKGDYIVVYENGNGLGKAVAPEDLTVDLLAKIAGRAWGSSDREGINLINVVVGVKTNEWIGFIRAAQTRMEALQLEIEQLKNVARENRKILEQLVPGYKEAMTKRDLPDTVVEDKHQTITDAREKDKTNTHPMALKTDFKITREQVLDAFNKAEQILKEQGINTEALPIVQKLKTNPQYMDEVIAGMLKSFEKLKD